MKLTKPFLGVPDGEIYPHQYQPGDECPPELQAAAVVLGAADAPAGATPAVDPTESPAAAPQAGRKKK
ncbi:hypothetical protein LE190_16160 [Massilia oculi]|uniref:Uncharacterized protein n=1 Tax=Massilia hydrophila TaxID=3044279 RepID=A0ABS7YCM2_9BURK|nr:hypothetical protein [Massilia oculi]MCA1857448.1 hypothetical protein [Massilia oculi]